VGKGLDFSKPLPTGVLKVEADWYYLLCLQIGVSLSVFGFSLKSPAFEALGKIPCKTTPPLPQVGKYCRTSPFRPLSNNNPEKN